MANYKYGKKESPFLVATLILPLLVGALFCGPARAVAIDPTIAPTSESDIGVLNPGDEWLHFQWDAPGHFKDVYNFSIVAADANAFAAVFEFTAFANYVIDDMALELYRGASGTGPLISSAALPNLWLSADLAPADYSLFVLGYASGADGGAYSALLKVGVSPAGVPEPGTTFLFMAGLMGMFAVVYGKRVARP